MRWWRRWTLGVSWIVVLLLAWIGVPAEAGPASRDRQLELQDLEQRAEAELASGRCEEALGWSDRSLAVARRRGEASDEVTALQLRARILADCERPDAAEEVLAEALALASKADDVYQQALIHQRLGSLAVRAHRHEKALVHLETAVRLLAAVDAPLTEMKTWLMLSHVYAYFQDRGSATEARERALEIARGSGSRMAEAITELIGVLQRLQFGQGDRSEVARKLAQLLERPGMREAEPAEELRQLLKVSADLLNQDRSVAGPPPVGKVPGLPGFFTSMLRGVWHYRRGELATAREHLLAALSQTPAGELEANLLGLVGAAYWKEGKNEEAIGYLSRAVDIFERNADEVRAEELPASYLGGDKQLFFHHLIELLVAQGRTGEAFDYAERARAQAFLQGLGNRRQMPERDADEQLVREAKTLRRQILDLEREAAAASAHERKRRSSDLERARQRYQPLLIRLKGSIEYASLARVEPLHARAVQEELPPDTTLISYFVFSTDQVHAWVLDREAFHHVRLPFRRGDLRRAVCWADEVGHGVGRRDAGDRDTVNRGVEVVDPRCPGEAASAEELYQRLIAPLAGRIRHSRLILIPHGPLHYLPFAALRRPAGGRYLIEDYTLTYSPSASALRFLRAKETPVAGRALVLGDPLPDPSSLRAAGREARAAARLLGTEPLLGPRAAESRLHRLDGQVDLLHIAAHGFYEPASPLFSRIALAPGEGHDGNLEVHEILSGLDLSGVNLVVLSACRTAAGERSGGDDVVGLTRAFLYAGSPGVISTLWDIDDDASAVLMEELYRRLLAGASAADALRQAQLALLRDPRNGNPYFWAAFSLTGDPQGRWEGHRARRRARRGGPRD